MLALIHWPSAQNTSVVAPFPSKSNAGWDSCARSADTRLTLSNANAMLSINRIVDSIVNRVACKVHVILVFSKYIVFVRAARLSRPPSGSALGWRAWPALRGSPASSVSRRRARTGAGSRDADGPASRPARPSASRLARPAALSQSQSPPELQPDETRLQRPYLLVLLLRTRISATVP